jgi:hypothetical protein
MEVIYQNNDCEITIERGYDLDLKVNVNGENLIWISNDEKENFIRELQSILNKYKI